MDTFLHILSQIWIFTGENKTSIFFILLALAIEIIARHLKHKNKNLIVSQYGESTDQENSEFYLQYYRKNQTIDFIRVITSLLLVSSLFVIHTDIGLGFFSVAAGAIIIAFRDFILSVLAFFFVTPSFPIGMTVKVGDAQGQIVFIRMLGVGILGKDIKGEATGTLFIVPSHKFITEIVHKEDLHSNSIFKDRIEIPYIAENFTLSFEDFLQELRSFLQETFPLRNANNVGNFTSYTGHRYKLNFSFHEEKYIGIEIRFIGTSKQNAKYKEQIIVFTQKFQKHSSF